MSRDKQSYSLQTERPHTLIPVDAPMNTIPARPGSIYSSPSINDDADGARKMSSPDTSLDNSPMRTKPRPILTGTRARSPHASTSVNTNNNSTSTSTFSKHRRQRQPPLIASASTTTVSLTQGAQLYGTGGGFKIGAKRPSLKKVDTTSVPISSAVYVLKF